MSEIEFSPSDTCAYLSQIDGCSRANEIAVEKSDVRWMIDQLAVWAGLTPWPRPISVSERLPPRELPTSTVSDWVLAYTKDGYWTIAFNQQSDDGSDYWEEQDTCDRLIDVTYWLPLPLIPGK